MEDLEDRVIDRQCSKGIRNKVFDYVVTTTGSWAFYTPLLAPLEHYVAGMNEQEVILSRLMAGGAHMFIAYPIQKLRSFFASRLGAYTDSSFWKKQLVNGLALLSIHPIVYTAILTTSGASLDEIQRAVPQGLGVALATMPFYNRFSDWWRHRMLKIPPTFGDRRQTDENTIVPSETGEHILQQTNAKTPEQNVSDSNR